MAMRRPIRTRPGAPSGGNPTLTPYIADVADLSFEKYFANRKGYISLAAFYKHLESYVYNHDQIFDFTGYPTGGVTPVINFGKSSAPDNGEGGWIKGLELSISAPFDIFHPALEGFGAQFSASTTDSEVQPDPTQAPTRPAGSVGERHQRLAVLRALTASSPRISAPLSLGLPGRGRRLRQRPHPAFGGGGNRGRRPDRLRVPVRRAGGAVGPWPRSTT